MQISLKIPITSPIGDRPGTETSIEIRIQQHEMEFLREAEPVAWAALMSGLERIGFTIARQKID